MDISAYLVPKRTKAKVTRKNYDSPYEHEKGEVTRNSHRWEPEIFKETKMALFWNTNKKPTGRDLLEKGSGVELCTKAGHGGYPKNLCWHCLINTNENTEVKEETRNFNTTINLDDQ